MSVTHIVKTYKLCCSADQGDPITPSQGEQCKLMSSDQTITTVSPITEVSSLQHMHAISLARAPSTNANDCRGCVDAGLLQSSQANPIRMFRVPQ